MKIDITKKEFRSLLDIFQIADWVLHAYDIEENPRTRKYREIEQKFLALAKEMGFGHWVEYASEVRGYLPTAEYENQSDFMEFIEEYDNETFWDQLCDRLAFRDLIKQEGEDNVKKMGSWKRLEKLQDLSKKYSDEFETYNLERVKVGP